MSPRQFLALAVRCPFSSWQRANAGESVSVPMPRKYWRRFWNWKQWFAHAANWL